MNKDRFQLREEGRLSNIFVCEKGTLNQISQLETSVLSRSKQSKDGLQSTQERLGKEAKEITYLAQMEIY